MIFDVRTLALAGILIAGPVYAAEPDPHAGHHPPQSPAAPAPPATQAPPASPPASNSGGMMSGSRGSGMMKDMSEGRGMPGQAMTGGSMPMDAHQRMMDHMTAVHGVSPTGMARRPGDALPMSEHVEACLAYLKAELKITAAQARPWETFADRLRANAAKIRNLRAPTPKGTAAEGSLAQRLDHQEKWFATGYDNIRALKPVVAQLYSSLSQEQRKIADMIIPPHLDLMQAM